MPCSPISVIFDNLKQFTKGIRQHVADKKVQEGDVDIVGKKKMGFNLYKKICQLFMKEEGKEFIFAHAFLTLKWNLMARFDNVVQAHICMFTGRMIALCFALSKAKATRQAGTTIKRGMFMPTPTILKFPQFMLLHVIYSQIQVRFLPMWMR
jgi:hypothetical protein